MPVPDEAMQLGFLESPIAQVVLRHRRIVACNRALEALFRFPRSELIGRSIRRLYPSIADFRDIGDRCETMLRTGQSYRDERFMQAADSEIFWARAWGVTLSPADPFALTVWGFERIETRAGRPSDMTPRERQVAHHVVNGRTCKEIGKILGISHRTVEVHRAKLMKKLGAKNTAELVSEIVLVL
ncbi:LuxR C-terminal-related transcriptional regulator [Frigidibacter sp. MR17.14]|uniref:LuxR C-terminal-related transcriptional regulator n=1 Tax=Frigidibacter sp. MR17.14 TaxID=3126509 RepID=UPI003012EAC5